METREFQAESRQLLDLMIHSIYSNKDIFLRELISNASDALDKIRFEALTNKDLESFVEDQHIFLEPNTEPRTLTIHDNGIGMSREEVVDFIGTIAKSGSREFLDMLQKNKDKEISPELIGQFGVGFYSSFMVADSVSMITRKAGEETATKWESSGDGTYTLDDAERDTPGTSITLHLKEVDSENELHDYTAEWKLKEIVKKYSDFVSYPVKMNVEREEKERDEEGNVKEDGETKKVVTTETLNSMKAIWTRSESEVSEEDYNEFYKHISHDWTDPLKHFSIKAEGTFEFRALLYLPAKAPFDLFYQDAPHGVQLYIKRVFIMSDCKELVPQYLRFVKGVVDSEDLSLNISREILQKDRHIQLIKKRVVSKVLDTLKDLKKKDFDAYLGFWNEFGRALKEGLFSDADNREKLLGLTLFHSTNELEKLTTLDDYIERMNEGQDKIYFLTGESIEAIQNSPHLEAFKAKGYEVLLLTDPVDEVWSQQPMPMAPTIQYKEKNFHSIGQGEVDLESEEEKKESEENRKQQEEQYKSLFEKLQKDLDEHVKEVRLSTRLTESPVCLVGDIGAMTPQLEAMLKASGQEIPKTKRILEVNATHPILEKLQALFGENPEDPRIAEYADLLFGQACLAEGNQPPDPAKFSKTVAEVMARAI